MGVKWNAREVVQTFRRYTKLWGQYGVPLRTIGQYVTEISKQAFDNQSDPATGQAWPSLNPIYAAYKRKQRRSPQALIWGGHLKRGIGYSVTIPRVTIGPSVHYGVHHQFGTGGMSLGRSGGSRQSLPARPFLGLSPTHEKEIEKMISNFITGKRG